MYRLSVVEQQHQEFLAKFLQSRVWHGWNGSNPASGINWDSQEMMALINETLLGSSALVSGLPVGGATPSDGDLLLNGLYGGEGSNGTAAALPFGGDYFMAFNRAYFSVHGYLAIVISIFGIVSNVINIAVLSQKTMVTPTNAILTALALVDVLVMLTYVPFALHQFILRSMLTITQWRSYSWMVFICFNINFTIVCHTISVWLTITLAVFRYIAVTFPAKVLEYCSMKRAVMAIASSFFFTAIICTPSYLSVQVSEVTEKELLELVDWREEGNFTAMYRIEESDLSKNNKNIPRIISFYAFSVLAKLVPCFVLTWLSIQLVRALLQAERRRFNLKNPTGLRLVPTSSATYSSTSNGGGQRGSLATATATETTHFLAPPGLPTSKLTYTTTNNSNNSPQNPPQQQQRPPAGRDRTTRMLLAILIFFLITEFPSGLMALFSCFSQEFFTHVYGPLGDLMDILALVNSSVNFILYCSMSRQFRKTFCHMFVPRSITRRWKQWKGAGRRTGLAMAERTVTYYPVLSSTNKNIEDIERD